MADVAGEPRRFVVRTDARATPAVGQRIRVGLRSPGDVHLVDAATGRRVE